MSTTLRQTDSAEAARQLAAGKLGIIRTDTIYGIVTKAADADAVERLYRVRGRDDGKPCIVLIADLTEIFDLKAAEPFLETLESYWPGKVSVILPAGEATPAHVHRGTGTVAYRLPAEPWLRELLEQTGPLLAPSANPQGEPPATTIEAAKAYFGEDVDIYVDGGEVSDTTPSMLLRVSSDGQLERLR